MEGKQHLHDLLGSLGRPLPEYSLHSKGGVDHQPTFTCKCTLKDEGLHYISDPQATKQKAENDAAMKAFEELQKKELKTTVQIAKQPPSGNFKGTLQEYCQKNGLAIPSYTNFSSPPSIRNHYGCKVTVSGDRAFTTTEYYTTQKAAQQAVAEKAYMALISGESEPTNDREIDDLRRGMESTSLETTVLQNHNPGPHLSETENTNFTVPVSKKPLTQPIFIPSNQQSDNVAVNKIQNSEKTTLFRN